MKLSRRKAVVRPGTVREFPPPPGWWVQWSGRTDWFPLTDGEGPRLLKILAGGGDRVVHVEGKAGPR